jgi:hypothetical protein
MRKIERRDGIMMNNVRVLLKRSVFRELSMEEIMAASQAYAWTLEFTSEMEREGETNAALASAKCVDPGPVPVPDPAPATVVAAQKKGTKSGKARK